MFAVKPANFFYSKGLKVSISFLLSRLIMANLNNNIINIANGMHIRIVVILNGLLSTVIKGAFVASDEFHCGELMYGNFSVLGIIEPILSQASE